MIYKMKNFEAIVPPLLSKKYGLEIGGPSPNREYLYKNTSGMDNVVFAEQTAWALNKNKSEYNYYPGKSGKIIISEATDMHLVPNKKYDFVLLCHSLEHIANPLKALIECKRVVKDGGYIIILVPEKTECFDHKRSVTPLSVLMEKFHKQVGEDDLSSLPEILDLHDLTRDLPAGDFEHFQQRSLDNYKNRCLHHHVFSEDLLKQIAVFLNCSVVSTGTKGLDIHIIMRLPPGANTQKDVQPLSKTMPPRLRKYLKK